MFGSEYSPSHLERTTRERNKKNNRKIQYIYFCQNKCDNVPTVEGSGSELLEQNVTPGSGLELFSGSAMKEPVS